MATITVEIPNNNKLLFLLLKWLNRYQMSYQVHYLDPDTDDTGLDEADAELLESLQNLATLPNNTPYSVAESKQRLGALKMMD